MAKGGTIEIDVELSGGQDIRQGFDQIGSAGKALTETMGATNEKLGEGLAGVGESVFGLADTFGELKNGIKNVGQTGAKGLIGLLGPIGMVVTAGFALYESFRMISGAAQEAEENQAAMAAAAGDLQSKLEALSEKGIQPTVKELAEFSRVTIEGQFAKDKLQVGQEKLTKTFQKAYEIELKVNKLREQASKGINARAILDGQLKEAIEDLNKARKAEITKIEKHLKLQIEVNKKIKAGEEIYKKHEETSAEFLKSKILENAEILKAIQLREAENNETGEALENSKIEIERINELTKVKAKANEENQKQLLAQSKALEAEIKKTNQVDLANETAQRKRDDRVLESIKKQEEARAKSRQRIAESRRRQEAEEQQRIQKERQDELRRISESARIKQLMIESEEDSTLKQIKLARHRYETTKELAKNNSNQQLIARLAFENQVKAINKQAMNEKLEVEREQEEKRRSFALETREFNIQQIQDETQRDLAMLRMQYDERYEIAKNNQEQTNELQRRYTIERLQILSRETNAMRSKFKDMFADMGRGFADAAVGAMLMGESFKDGIALVLQGLARQAGVEALMQTAKGLAALVLFPAAASNHFAAAGAFGSAALAAGVASSAMGGGGGGIGGGGGGRFSPSGSPQSSQAPPREEATASSMVFNVNFSGAVIYDTKKAAEQAMADRITRVMKSNRRGSPRS